jgi:hypothetical protein
MSMPSHYKVIGAVSQSIVSRAIEEFKQLGYEVEPGTAIEYPGDRRIRLRWIVSDCDKCEEAVCLLRGMTIMLQQLLSPPSSDGQQSLRS